MDDYQVLTNCENTGNQFNVKVEQRNGDIVVVEAEHLEEQGSTGSGDGRSESITGQFTIDFSYSGCPHCGNNAFFKCNTCGNLSCHDGSKSGYCITCENEIQLRGDIEEVSGSKEKDGESGKLSDSSGYLRKDD